MADVADKKGFILMRKYKAVFEELGPELGYALLMALFDYEEKRTEPPKGSPIRLAFISIKVDLDEKRANWKKTEEDRRKAGAIGGQHTQAKRRKLKQNKQSEANEANQADSDSECDSECDGEGDLSDTQDTTAPPAPAGARNVIHFTRTDFEAAGRVELAYAYKQAFGDDNAAEIVGALIGDFGFSLAYDCVTAAAARASPPDEPAAYIRAMCENRRDGVGVLGGG
jgi:hypothetical protein